jgi:hypothetical protein
VRQCHTNHDSTRRPCCILNHQFSSLFLHDWLTSHAVFTYIDGSRRWTWELHEDADGTPWANEGICSSWRMNNIAISGAPMSRSTKRCVGVVLRCAEGLTRRSSFGWSRLQEMAEGPLSWSFGVLNRHGDRMTFLYIWIWVNAVNFRKGHNCNLSQAATCAYK